jgi:hypothetical protein
MVRRDAGASKRSSGRRSAVASARCLAASYFVLACASSPGSLGTFYEGAIVTGHPTDETDGAIQNNIIGAGYK